MSDHEDAGGSLVVVLDAYAEKTRITRSEAVRRLIEAGLKRRPKP